MTDSPPLLYSLGPGKRSGARTAGADRPRANSRGLVGLAFVLAVLFVIAPSSLAGGSYGRSVSDNGPLVDATRVSFVEFWNSGRGEFPSALQSTVDYWLRYHVAKALIAALLAAVLIVLGARVWRSLARSGGRGRTVALTSAGVGVTMLAMFAIALVMANIQGAIAPFSSLLSLLGPEQRGGELAVTIDQIREMLAEPAGTSGLRSLALDTIVSDFSRYHAALAGMAAAGAAGLVVLGVMSWRASSSATRSSTPARRLLRAASVLSIAFAMLMLLVTVANTSNATAPENGLLLFFGPA